MPIKLWSTWFFSCGPALFCDGMSYVQSAKKFGGNEEVDSPSLICCGKLKSELP